MFNCHSTFFKDRTLKESKNITDENIDIFDTASVLSFGNIKSWQMELNHHYPDGASFDILFQSDGLVRYYDESSGSMPFVHMDEDSAPAFFLDTLLRFGIDIIKSCKPYDLVVEGKPTIKIDIVIFSCDTIWKSFRTTLCSGFNETPLIKFHL